MPSAKRTPGTCRTRESVAAGMAIAAPEASLIWPNRTLGVTVTDVFW